MQQGMLFHSVDGGEAVPPLRRPDERWRRRARHDRFALAGGGRAQEAPDPAGIDLAAVADRLPVPIAGIEDAYPLSPMQQGMLFHTVDGSSDLYINQMSVGIGGLEAAASPPRGRRRWTTIRSCAPASSGRAGRAVPVRAARRPAAGAGDRLARSRGDAGHAGRARGGGAGEGLRPRPAASDARAAGAARGGCLPPCLDLPSRAASGPITMS